MAFFYFVAFVVVCAYTLLNLYVGVIFNQFSRIRTLSQTGSAFLTQKQQVREAGAWVLAGELLLLLLLLLACSPA